MGDCGRSGVESESAALVEACQPTESNRDTNIQRKYSRTNTDVLVFVNGWIKAEDRETQERRQKSREEEERSLSLLKAAHAIKGDVRKYNTGRLRM